MNVYRLEFRVEKYTPEYVATLEGHYDSEAFYVKDKEKVLFLIAGSLENAKKQIEWAYQRPLFISISRVCILTQFNQGEGR